MILALVASPILGVADAAANGGGLPDWVTILISLIVALGGGGGVVQLAKVKSDKQSVLAGTEKSRAEAADQISDTAISMLQPLRDELTRTRLQHKEEIDRLTGQMNTLELKLVQERDISDARIRQLQNDISERDNHIRSQGAEIIELRTRIRSAPGWPTSSS